jgi:hypothetical protein
MGKDGLAQFIVNKISFTADNMMFGISETYKDFQYGNGSFIHDTVDFTSVFLSDYDIDNSVDTTLFGYRSMCTNQWGSFAVYLNSTKSIIDSLFLYKYTRSYDPQFPDYESTSTENTRLYNVPYKMSSTKDTIHFHIRGEFIRFTNFAYSYQYENRSRFSHSYGNTDTLIEHPDSSYIELLLVGAFPFSAKEIKVPNQVSINIGERVISVGNQTTSGILQCYNLLGKKYTCHSIGRINDTEIFSISNLYSGCYLFANAGSTYKFIIP